MAHDKITELPPFISGVIDLGRLLREAENIDDNLHQLKLRKSGTTIKMPKTTQLMDNVTKYYKLNLLQATDRSDLIKYLTRVKNHSPVIHMSFSADPSPAFLEKLVAWLRSNIHPELLLTIGLQPVIGAGCIVRTTNKYFDFSLRENMKKSKPMLQKKIVEAVQLNPAPASHRSNT